MPGRGKSTVGQKRADKGLVVFLQHKKMFLSIYEGDPEAKDEK